MEDSSGHKRPRSRPQQVELQKRHNTRSTRQSSTETCNGSSNGIQKPIRIHQPTHSLYFLRLHKLFFLDEKESEDGSQSVMESAASATGNYTPRIVRFGNLRLQSIYKSPNIYIIDQFLSTTDIQHLFTHFISKFKFQRSFIDDGNDVGKGNYEEEAVDGSNMTTQQHNNSSHRTSAFLALNKQHDSRIASIEHKVASLFGCTAQQIEALQLVRYQSPDQYFHVHHDLGVYNESTGKVELPKKSIWYQRRMITLFCYLNTVPPKNGGATYFPCCINQTARKSFVDDGMIPVTSAASMVDATAASISESEHHSIPKIDPDCVTQNKSGCIEKNADQSIVCDHDGLRIFPVAGRAVIFSNVLASGIPDSRSIHAGEPVITSRKRNDEVKYSMNSLLKSDSYHCSKTKYGLNVWICES